uniref:Uncharacterized protein n=1 Tax=Plectus sambesii TaxID=2011161 RepID=A0A914UR59_9BILA
MAWIDSYISDRQQQTSTILHKVIEKTTIDTLAGALALFSTQVTRIDVAATIEWYFLIGWWFEQLTGDTVSSANWLWARWAYYCLVCWLKWATLTDLQWRERPSTPSLCTSLLHPPPPPPFIVFASLDASSSTPSLEDSPPPLSRCLGSAYSTSPLSPKPGCGV